MRVFFIYTLTRSFAVHQQFNRMFQGTGGSYLSAGDPRVHFGLGGIRALDEVQVRWPGGRTTVLKNVPADREVAGN